MPSELRATFDEEPQLYDRMRPGYPDDLFQHLVDTAGIGVGSRVVEIGPGTGQATVRLAASGATVVAVELGAGLAQVLAAKTGSDVEVVVSTFEDWQLPPEPFDLVAAFTAWHWLDPERRTSKAAEALRPGGTLATITTEHVAGGTEPFFRQAAECYGRWDPATPVGLWPVAPDTVPPFMDEADHSPLFEPAVRRRYLQEVDYTTQEYLDLLRTYSGHRALPARLQRGLFGCIEQLIDGSYDGHVVKRYLYELRLARRRTEPSASPTRPPGAEHLLRARRPEQ